MCNQCNTCCDPSYLPGPCNTCTNSNVNPCTIDCSLPLWATWPRIEIRRCNLPSLYGCCQNQCNQHRVYEDSSSSSSSCSSSSSSSEDSYEHKVKRCYLENQCYNPCQNYQCDPTIGLCASGCGYRN